MKKISQVLLLLALLCAGGGAKALAQNKLFEKYDDRNKVEYVCITKAMLKMMTTTSNNQITINNVKIDGITDALDVLLIIKSEDPEACAEMKQDFQTLKGDNSYEVLMVIKDDGSRVMTLYNRKASKKELVTYIDEGESKTFIVLAGNLSDQMLKQLMSK